MNRFLCFGSLNIDYTYSVSHFVRAGETLAAESVKTFCGGKGLNQSTALAKAGAEVFHAGSIGSDGKFLLEALKAAKVCTEYVSILEGERTGHAIIQNTPDGENCILIFGGANRLITKRQTDFVLEHFDGGDVLVLQNEINNIPYLISKARQKGMKIAFTPAPMDESVRSLPLEEVDYILLNESEAKALVGAKGDETSDKNVLAGMLSKMFPSVHFVLTLGEAGSMFIHGDERIFQKAFRAKAVDTTAAGDTFAGFFLQSITMGKTVEQALEVASKAAAVCVARKGAAASIPDFKELAGISFEL